METTSPITTAHLMQTTGRARYTLLCWARQLGLGRRLSGHPNAPFYFTPDEARQLEVLAQNKPRHGVRRSVPPTNAQLLEDE